LCGPLTGTGLKLAVRPLYGPVAGGTRVTISGENLA